MGARKQLFEYSCTGEESRNEMQTSDRLLDGVHYLPFKLKLGLCYMRIQHMHDDLCRDDNSFWFQCTHIGAICNGEVFLVAPRLQAKQGKS